MTKFQQLKQMIEQFESDLGIWADILCGIALFGTLFAILVIVP